MNATDLLDLPVLSGTYLSVQQGSEVQVAFDDDTTTTIPAETSWSYTQSSDDVSLSFSQDIPQGFYYGTIANIHKDSRPISVTPQELFSVQKENDISPIQANIPSSITVNFTENAVIDFARYVDFDNIDRVEVTSEKDVGIVRETNTSFSFTEMDSHESIKLDILYYDLAGNVSSYSTSIEMRKPSLQIQQIEDIDGSVLISGISDITFSDANLSLFRSDSDEKILEAPVNS